MKLKFEESAPPPAPAASLLGSLSPADVRGCVNGTWFVEDSPALYRLGGTKPQKYKVRASHAAPRWDEKAVVVMHSTNRVSEMSIDGTILREVTLAKRAQKAFLIASWKPGYVLGGGDDMFVYDRDGTLIGNRPSDARSYASVPGGDAFAVGAMDALEIWGVKKGALELLASYPTYKNAYLQFRAQVLYVRQGSWGAPTWYTAR